MVEIRLRHNLGNFQLNIDLKTDAKRVGILGASGAGKSMTLKMLAGILSPDQGYISMNDKVMFNTDSGRKVNIKPQKRKIGYLFQNYALFPSMTVEENIGAGISGRMNPGQAEKKQEIVADMIRRFSLTGLEKQLPSQLSGGQQQRVALARILAYEPDMILLDEPCSALDIHLRDRMQRELLNQLADYPGPVFMVSHSRDEIYRFSDEIVIIDQGKIIAQGDKKEVFARPATKAAAALTGCKNFSAATRLDDHTLRADSWGIVIHTKAILPEEVHFIGYRAHDFLPVWGEKEENCIPFLLERKDQLPFEENYYIRSDREDYDQEDVISWFVQRNLWGELAEKGLPDYLKIQEERILYFKE